MHGTSGSPVCHASHPTLAVSNVSLFDCVERHSHRFGYATACHRKRHAAFAAHPPINHEGYRFRTWRPGRIVDNKLLEDAANIWQHHRMSEQVRSVEQELGLSLSWRRLGGLGNPLESRLLAVNISTASAAVSMRASRRLVSAACSGVTWGGCGDLGFFAGFGAVTHHRLAHSGTILASGRRSSPSTSSTCRSHASSATRFSRSRSYLS